MSKRTSGFTLLEALAASVIMAVGITAAYVAWLACYNNYDRARQASQAGQIARQCLEQAKVSGIFNLPLGSMASNGLYQWVGSYDPTSQTWVSGTSASKYVINGYSYYDVNGFPLTSATSPAVKFISVVQITDYYPVTSTTSAYWFDDQSKRCPVVFVQQVNPTRNLVSMGTTMVMGGS
ncbi:MAG TPA: type II secretion system protein [Fimbriimonas sp.]|nr:type II secretion system protein [Fimbriimonas sp.]